MAYEFADQTLALQPEVHTTYFGSGATSGWESGLTSASFRGAMTPASNDDGPVSAAYIFGTPEPSSMPEDDDGGEIIVTATRDPGDGDEDPTYTSNPPEGVPGGGTYDAAQYPSCVEAAPLGVDPSDILDKANALSVEIAQQTNQAVEYGAFIYEINGLVLKSDIFTDNLPGRVDFLNRVLDLPNGAHILATIHNHPYNGIEQGTPSAEYDWPLYNSFFSIANSQGITVDPDMLMFIRDNHDATTRIYDKTDQNQHYASCPI